MNNLARVKLTKNGKNFFIKVEKSIAKDLQDLFDTFFTTLLLLQYNWGIYRCSSIRHSQRITYIQIKIVSQEKEALTFDLFPKEDDCHKINSISASNSFLKKLKHIFELNNLLDQMKIILNSI